MTFVSPAIFTLTAYTFAGFSRVRPFAPTIVCVGLTFNPTVKDSFRGTRKIKSKHTKLIILLVSHCSIVVQQEQEQEFSLTLIFVNFEKNFQKPPLAKINVSRNLILHSAEMEVSPPFWLYPPFFCSRQSPFSMLRRSLKPSGTINNAKIKKKSTKYFCLEPKTCHNDTTRHHLVAAIIILFI